MTSAAVRQVIEEFIELYRANPCLWQIKCKDYRDRAKKNAAYNILADKLREIEPDASQTDVVKKINNLRSSCRKELKKYERSVKTATSFHDIYKPKLWYYDQLSFVNEQDTLEDNVSSLDGDEDIASDPEYTPIQQYCRVVDTPTCTSFDDTSRLDTSESSRQKPLKMKMTEEVDDEQLPIKQARLEEDELLRLKQDRLEDDELLRLKQARLEDDELRLRQARLEDDRCQLVGKSVAVKLKGLEKRQQLIAEKLINDVLFEAELGVLTLEHKCIPIPVVQLGNQCERGFKFETVT